MSTSRKRRKSTADVKQCPRCKNVFHRDYFGYRANGHTRSYCPSCKRDYSNNYDETSERRKQYQKDAWDTSKPGKGKGDGRPCPYCGEIFYPVLVNLNRGFGNHCSVKCGTRATRSRSTVRVICEGCHEGFDALESEVNRGRGRFCTIDCWYSYNSGENSPLWTGGTHPGYRGSDWLEIRREIIARDGYKCVYCGKTEMLSIMEYGSGLHVHHIIPYNETRDNSYENLETTCASCHGKAEKGSINGKS